jgi:hypothetical protein
VQYIKRLFIIISDLSGVRKSPNGLRIIALFGIIALQVINDISFRKDAPHLKAPVSDLIQQADSYKKSLADG